MEDVPVRHYLNPAFQPEDKYSISIPILGYTNIGYNNNSFSLNDLDNLSLSALYNKLGKEALVSGYSQLNILTLGYAFNNSFLSLTISQKAEVNTGLPKDLFKFMIYGTTEVDNNLYSLDALSLNSNIYTETGFGYSQQIDEQWTLGVKLKLLNGNANLNYTNNLSLSANIDKWNLNGNAALRYSGPAQLKFDELSMNPSITYPQKKTDWFKHNGLGAGVDFGVQFRMLENLYLSASITDFGFIKWKNNVLNNSFQVDYSFDGFVHLNSDMTVAELNTELGNINNLNSITDSLVAEFKNSINLNSNSIGYTTYTTAKIYAAVQYNFLSNRLNLGLLYSSYIDNKFEKNKITASVTGRPFDWLSSTINYTFLNGYNYFGGGISIKTGIFNFFSAIDFSTMSYAMVPISKVKIPLPYNEKSFNFSAGINIAFGKRERKTNFITSQPYHPKTGLYKPKFKKVKFLWDK